MYLDSVWDLVQGRVFEFPSSEGLFNPYSERRDEYDVEDAVAIRRDNFRQYLAAYKARPPMFLLAEAPGPWGCRFSGVPLVSESQLVDPLFPIDGRQTSLEEVPHGEYTANIYWRILGPYFPHFFTWNSVPLHPFKPGNEMSIRNPGQREVARHVDTVRGMIEIIRPDRVLAIGRKAEYALGKIDVACTYVRHPSQGGARKFEAGVLAIVNQMNLTPSIQIDQD